MILLLLSWRRRRGGLMAISLLVMSQSLREDRVFSNGFNVGSSHLSQVRINPTCRLSPRGHGLTVRKRFMGVFALRHNSKANGKAHRVERLSSRLQMRDASSANWFKVGDCVQVVDDVTKGGSNLLGERGIVVETWEKCDVDPTCCCAEQVDLGMAVHVRFDGSVDGGSHVEAGESFVHYFAEEELLQVASAEGAVKEDEGSGHAASNASTSAAFDGLSCADFKLKELDVGSHVRGIAKFEPVSPAEQTSAEESAMLEDQG